MPMAASRCFFIFKGLIFTTENDHKYRLALITDIVSVKIYYASLPPTRRDEVPKARKGFL